MIRDMLSIGNFSVPSPSICALPINNTANIDITGAGFVCPVVPAAMPGPPVQRHHKPKQEPYSDATSAYWAPGWDWERWSHPEVEFGDTSPEEIEKMRQGIMDVLGEDEFDDMLGYLQKKHKLWNDRKMVADGVPPPDYSQPDFIKRWIERHDGGEVGFVAFRTTLYDDEDRWLVYIEQVARLLGLSFDRVGRWHRWHEHDEVREARIKFTLHWIEDEALNGASAETLRARYRQLREQKRLPAAMEHYSMFLCASPEAVASVLNLGDDEETFPTVESDYWRDDAPFLLVVMEQPTMDPHGPEEPHDPDDPHDERNWYKSVFKVPAEIVYSELWHLEDRSYVAPTRLTRSVKGSEELGGKMPENFVVDGLQELWWGMGPTPQSLKRRARLRGMRG